MCIRFRRPSFRQAAAFPAGVKSPPGILFGLADLRPGEGLDHGANWHASGDSVQMAKFARRRGIQSAVIEKIKKPRHWAPIKSSITATEPGLISGCVT